MTIEWLDGMVISFTNQLEWLNEIKWLVYHGFEIDWDFYCYDEAGAHIEWRSFLTMIAERGM